MRLDSPDLAAVVARLERQLRTVKLALGAVLMAIGGLSLTAWIAPQGDTISAKQFMVLDADGIPRGMFGVLADQASIGMMYTDPSGNTRLEMVVDPDGTPRLALMDEKGRVRSEISKMQMRPGQGPQTEHRDRNEGEEVVSNRIRHRQVRRNPVENQCRFRDGLEYAEKPRGRWHRDAERNQRLYDERSCPGHR